MPTPIELYAAQLRHLTANCADPWFSEQLARSRTGDNLAARLISESCLRLVLNVAKRCWWAAGPLSLLDLVQEGNATLMKTIERFRGAKADEFLHELTQRLESRFAKLAVDPSPFEDPWD